MPSTVPVETVPTQRSANNPPGSDDAQGHATPQSPPAMPPAVPPTDDSLNQRETTAAAQQKQKKKTVFVIDQVEHPTAPRRRPPPGHFKAMRNPRFKGLMAASVALLGNNLLVKMAQATINNPIAQIGLAGFDVVTETFDEVDFFSFRAVTSPRFKVKKGHDPDFPTFAQAMSRPDAEEWMGSMDVEIETLVEMGTWTLVPRSEAAKAGKKVIKSTWAFRQKCDPAGNPTKKKGRFCVRGDLQSKFEEFESYSPVVQWSTVRLMLILSIVHGLETRQVDYVNAFAQADLDRDVFIEIPDGYEHTNDVDCVLKLNKSLYGMTDAPLMFFELLKKNLLDAEFEQLEHIDPCLFVHKHAICLTYVDDCLWFGKDGAALD